MRRSPPARDPWVPLLAGALPVFVAGLCLQPVTETDLFFRLKVGTEILARRALLERNLFSFTAPDHPDLDLSWAFEVAAALVYAVGGFPGIVLAKTAWVVATFLGAFVLCRRQGGGALATALTLGAVALVMRERLVERPHIVSFTGELVVMAAVAYLAGRPVRMSRGWAAAFLLAMVAWANMHAGVFAGPLLAILAAVGAAPGDRRLARALLLLGAVIAVAATLTPVGPVGIVRYLQLHITIPRLHAVDEFRPATWRSDWPFLVWLLALGLAVGTRVLLARSARPAWAAVAPPPEPSAPLPAAGTPVLAQVLPVAGMALLGLGSVRFAADAAWVGAPLLATTLTGFGRIFRTRDWVGASRRVVIAAACLALLAATLVPRLVAAPSSSGGGGLLPRALALGLDLDLDRSSLPLDALRFVEANGLRERMYNDFEIGSYLLFEGYPRHRVFVDPRLPAYPEEMHRLLGSFDLDRVAWGEAMTRYGVETALLAYAGVNRRVAWWDPQDWALVYRAGDARVFVRRREKWRQLIAAHEIPATFAFTVEEGASTRLIERRPARSPVSDCEWQRRLGELAFELDGAVPGRARVYYENALAQPGCLAATEEATLAAWMGALELKAPDHDHALTHLDRALQLSPADTRTRANRATLLERAGRRADASADWRRIATDARGTPLGDAAAARARSLEGDVER